MRVHLYLTQAEVNAILNTPAQSTSHSFFSLKKTDNNIAIQSISHLSPSTAFIEMVWLVQSSVLFFNSKGF